MVRIFERYLSDIGRERLLDPQDETDLARRSQAGDEAARRRLVSANLRFVVSVARSYRGRGVSLADLVNEGNVGLVRAADRFDPERGVRFISYAHFWIRRAMIQAIAVQEERRRPGEPAPLRLSLDDVAPGAACTLGELLPDERTPEPGADLVRERLRDAIEASLTDLPPRESEVVRRYFGLGFEDSQTLAEISIELGVSRERARQLKERGLSRLRAGARRHGLRGFVDSGGPALGCRRRGDEGDPASLPRRPMVIDFTRDPK
ncbi:sigma-70 family RNA polymerase sigma factor [Candidatus Palauibacter sp.]|uniref:sigma-70 family RNA polymerase sigma factor n=1 Tax=Candidatus Palauibacter sp. TaxID=3101350 RepID=UPI003B59B7C7